MELAVYFETLMHVFHATRRHTIERSNFSCGSTASIFIDMTNTDLAMLISGNMIGSKERTNVFWHCGNITSEKSRKNTCVGMRVKLLRLKAFRKRQFVLYRIRHCLW